MSTAEVSVFIISSPCLSICWFNRRIARPIVTSLFEFERQFLPPASNDSPRYHHMDVIGDDVVQEALIMRNYQYAKIGPRNEFTPCATVLSASMSRPLSVSSSTAYLGSSIAICRISARFFSPPEKPSLTARDVNERSIPSSSIFS